MRKIEQSTELKRQFSQPALWDVFYENEDGTEFFESDFPDCIIKDAGNGNYTVERGNELILLFNEKDVASIDIMPSYNEGGKDTVSIWFTNNATFSASGM